jgi:hypothetical protein
MGRSAEHADERVERAVLALLLAFAGPAELSLEAIVCEIGNRPAVVRALARLEGVGLVGRIESSIWPTPAARRFDELNI